MYERTDSFYAMLGHGPLGEGYSLIATVEHVTTSMLDVEPTDLANLSAFAEHVRDRLSRYGAVVATEHGRTAACVSKLTQRYEPHCLHAHRLLFPGLDHIDVSRAGVNLEFVEYHDFETCFRDFDWPGQYLYAENPDGRCRIACAPTRLPRQFFRSVIARQRNEVGRADWQTYPALDIVAAAQRSLGLVA